MNLTEIIIVFKAQTGRLDLSRSEIINILNAATLVLDQLDTSDKITRVYKRLVAGDNTFVLPLPCRFIDSVTLLAAGVADKLVKADPLELRQVLRSEALGTPLAYAKYTAANAGSYSPTDVDLPRSGDTPELTTFLLVAPIPDSEFTLEVAGNFYSNQFSDDVEQNRWSLAFPLTLIQAAEYVMKKGLLNMEESAKILEDLKLQVVPMIHDTYADENINQMRG